MAPRTILRCQTGSTVLGTSLGDTDRDELGVFIEPIEKVVGFQSLEHVIYRDAHQRTGKHDAPSEPGDLDVTLYSLRKFLSLALKGNPTIVSLFFTPPENCPVFTPAGKNLQELAPKLLHRGTIGAFLGYMQEQSARLRGERGQKNVNREGLVKQYGYDTKYAYHIIRLGMQGVELAKTGKLTIPLPVDHQILLKAIRQGAWTLDYFNEQAKKIEDDLRSLRESSSLPKEPDTKAVERWMLRTYQDTWAIDSILKIQPSTL